MPHLQADTIARLVVMRESLENAKHGQVSGLAESFAKEVGKSVPTFWRWLKTHAGYASGRKVRTDAGKSKINEQTLHFIASARRETTRNVGGGKVLMAIATAMNIADASGYKINAHRATFARVMRNKLMDSKSLSNPRNHTQMRSLHPNHVHQIDPSLCVLYYLHGKQKMMTAERFYKNKLDAYTKVKLKVWRYVKYDHFSGCLDVYYFEAEGENQKNIFEFLLHTWGKSKTRFQSGVPKILLWDKGSANTAKTINNLLGALNIEVITHRAHAPWVKGGVEVGNNIVERKFESRLKLEPVETIDELNNAVASWVRAFNANAIKHEDNKIRRAGGSFVRDDLYSYITAEQLISMPDREVCEYYLAGKIEKRIIRNNLVSFAHPQTKKSESYDLREFAKYYSQGDSVLVTPLLIGDGVIRISIERFGNETLQAHVSPMREFDLAGRSMAANVIGEEYKNAPHTAAQESAKTLARVAYPNLQTGKAGSVLEAAEAKRNSGVKPFADKKISAHGHLDKAKIGLRLPRKATEMELPTPAINNIKTISATEILLRLFKRLSRSLTADENTFINKRYKKGASEEEFEALVDSFENPANRESLATGTFDSAPKLVMKG